MTQTFAVAQGHEADYMRGACEVIGCSCPSSHSALGRRKEAIAEHQAARVQPKVMGLFGNPIQLETPSDQNHLLTFKQN